MPSTTTPTGVSTPARRPAASLTLRSTDRYSRGDPRSFAESAELAEAGADVAVLVPTRTDSRLEPKLLAGDLARCWSSAAAGIDWSQLSPGERGGLLALVADGVFAFDDGQAVLTGPAAIDRHVPVALDGRHGSSKSGDGCIDRISRSVVESVARWSSGVPVDELATALYRAHTMPLDPARRGIDARAIEALDASAARWWRLPEAGDAADRGWWILWPHDTPTAMRDKLYVGLHPDDLEPAVPTVARVLARHGAPPFKLGVGPIGVHRPDKLVIYAASPGHRTELAVALREALSACRTHPVPFTHQLDDRGLISAGTDPERDDVFAGGASSWRYELCAELARGLVAAEELGVDGTPEHFAVRRLRLVGVDPDTWTPAAAGAAPIAHGGEPR